MWNNTDATAANSWSVTCHRCDKILKAGSNHSLSILILFCWIFWICKNSQGDWCKTRWVDVTADRPERRQLKKNVNKTELTARSPRLVQRALVPQGLGWQGSRLPIERTSGWTRLGLWKLFWGLLGLLVCAGASWRRLGQPSMVLWPGKWLKPSWQRHTAAPPGLTCFVTRGKLMFSLTEKHRIKIGSGSLCTRWLLRYAPRFHEKNSNNFLLFFS
jgi:hypothetical protein